MAEFALGLTKTAVAGTVSRVKSAIEEEKKLRVSVQDDLVFISGEFEMMQSFLNVANAERTNNQVVQTWVRQIRGLAFDVEDCVEFVVHLDKASHWDWVRRLFSSLICMSRPPLPLDVAVAEIKRLKARVEDVSQRNTRYNLIGDSGSNSNPAAAVASPVLELLPATSVTCTSSSAFHILRDVWKAAGKIRPDMGDLRKLVNSEGSNVEVISLWGCPGAAADLGVTQVLREAYNDQAICTEFKIRAWIKLIHPFNPDEFLKSLLTQLYATSSYHQSNLEPCSRTMEEFHLIKVELMQQVKQHKYLVIIQGIFSVVEWDIIRMYLPDRNNGSRIVVATQDLGFALSCTGDPYQVSELRKLSDGQSLCAFFSKVSGRRSDMSELIWQLRCRGVISVWGDFKHGPTLVDKLYTGITHKSKDFDGVEFDRYCWVDVQDYQIDLIDFSLRLFFNLHSNDLRAEKIAADGMMGATGVIEGCCRFLRDEDCLVVISGLQSTDQWDLIKENFLSEPMKGCILVLANRESVARYCVHNEDRAFNINVLEADAMTCHLIKVCEYHIGIGGREATSRGRLYSDRMEEARDWTNKFQHVVRQDRVYHLRDYLAYPGVISLCGPAGAGKSSLARRIYYNQLLLSNAVRGEEQITHRRVGGKDKYFKEFFDLGCTKYSWVDVPPHPFNLMDMFWRLLLDFHSDDFKAKEAVTIGMMYGNRDPIKECLEIMRQDKCFIVIDGLRSTEDWDLIRHAMLLSDQPPNGCIIVISNEESVGRYCTHHDQFAREFFVNALKEDVASPSLIKKKVCSDQRNRGLSNRMIEACDWFNKFDFIGHSTEWRRLHDRLFDDPFGVFSVWGIAGVGKSALVRRIYYSEMLGVPQRNMSDVYYAQGLLDQVTKYCWVDVTTSPFDLKEFSRRVLMEFLSDDLYSKEAAAIGMIEGQDPIEGCRNFLSQHRSLVVIRGLCSIHDWNLIKSALLSDPVNGFIIVITNEASVATHCVDKDYGDAAVINVKGLEPDAALNLLRKTAWEGKEVTSDGVELSRLITAKCGGLPRLIDAVGKYCHYGNGPEDWLTELNDNFMHILVTDRRFHCLKGLFSWMQSYFDSCSDELKPCIFYLSVFPGDQVIRGKRLLRRWIAEGYSRDQIGRSAEEDGEKLFTELIKLSIIQQLSPKSSNSKVNGLFHGYIMSRPMEDNLVFVLDGRCSINSQRAGQHLTVRSNWDRDKIVYESIDFTQVRSLTVFGEWKSFFVSTNVNMRLLRVLDLEDTSGVRDSDIEQIGKLLPRLKFLSLRGCIDITRLPNSLGGMRQLQTLDIKRTSIVTLPPAIMKLRKLRYIHAGTTHKPFEKDDSSMVEITPAVDEDPLTLTPGEDIDILHRASVADDGASIVRKEIWRRPRALVFNCLSKSRVHKLVSANDGVQFPAAAAAGIGRLTALHTLGVVKVGSCAGGKSFLRELKKLTQLRKLRLNGINQKNWKGFCCAISGQGYLESLSVRLDEDPTSVAVVYAYFSDINEPPRTLKTLKVYGKNARVSPVWIKQLHNLTKVDLELTVSTQEDINVLEDLRVPHMYDILCVRPIQDCKLDFTVVGYHWYGQDNYKLQNIKIDCSTYKVALVFGGVISSDVEVMVVHCSSTKSTLEISGLERFRSLKEVCVKGSYSEAVKQHLQQKVDEHANNPLLKLDPQQSSKSKCPTLCAC